jgi:ClpX C4-type zinc finger
MAHEPPPPVIDSARVLSYAFVDDIPYRKWGALYVDGKLLEQVPCLAVCTNLGKDSGPVLFHCDAEWNVLGTSGADTVEGVKERAEKNYPGVASRWVDINTSVEDALRYYDEETGGLKCSFCGKRAFDVEGWVEGNGAVICRGCIETYYRDFQDEPSGDSTG